MGIHLLVLVYAHDVEPVLLLSPWLKEFDLVVTKRSKQPLIPDIAHTIKSKFCLPLL